MAWEYELEQKIIFEEDKILFHESMKCLKAGCLRAGYIVAWLSIMESLKSKITTLSNQGEKRAEIAYKKIEQGEASLKSVDKVIIDEARGCNLIDDSEHKKLEFLWGERCKFAHPYKTAPSVDEFRYIISQSIELTLGRPLVFRKNYIDDFIETITNHSHYFQDNDVAISTVVSRIFPRIAPELHPYFLKSLLAKLGSILADPTRRPLLRRFEVIAMDLLEFNRSTLKDEIWGLEKIAVKYPETFIRVIKPEIWSAFPERVKEIIVQFSIKVERTEHTEFARSVMQWLISNLILEDKYKKTFYDFLNLQPLDQVFYFYAFDLDLLEQVSLNLKSFNFIHNNSAIAALEGNFGVEFIKTLDFEKKVKLGRLIMNAAIAGSFKANAYVKSNYIVVDKDILAGMLSMCFIDSTGSFRFRSDLLINVINKIASINQDDLITEIFMRIKLELSKMSNGKAYTKEAIGVLSNLQVTYSAGMNLQIKELKEVIEKLPIATSAF